MRIFKMPPFKKENSAKKENKEHQIQLTERDLAVFYYYNCDDKDRDMSTCPDCEFCPYFDLAREEFKLIMEKMPSNYTKDYWIFAFSPTYKGEELSRIHMRLIRKVETMEKSELKTGKWLIFVNKENVDKIWNKIKLATEEGSLGIEAKVSAAKPKSTNIGYEKDKHVICVYTYDWTDEKDVKRVREELRKLGITSKIPYKTDEDTIKGKYTSKGHKRISKYYE